MNHKTRVYDNILEMLSSEDNPTPLVKLNKVVSFKHTTVYAKLEWYNPFGAVKDRVAANLINDAEDRGLLNKNQKIVEPTSGNTGMGLAMIANAKGHLLSTPLSTAIPKEKRTTLRLFGADVIELSDSLCPAPGAPEGAIAKAMELAGQPEYHMLNQYENLANPEAHFKTTGPEIWKQTEKKVTHFVAGLGTCGTVTGTGRFLKDKDKGIKVFGVHPSEGHDIPGVRSIRQLAQTKLFFPDEYDQLIEINNKDAFNLCARLNKDESILAGPSSAMALAGALQLVPDEPGNIAVVIFPDSVFKYASSFEKHLPYCRSKENNTTQKSDFESEIISNAKNPYLSIEVDDAYAMLAETNPMVIDVRPPNEYNAGHIPNAVNIPLDQLTKSTDQLPDNREKPIIMVCDAGNISVNATLTLLSLGYHSVKNLNGGTNVWIDRGYEIS